MTLSWELPYSEQPGPAGVARREPRNAQCSRNTPEFSGTFDLIVFDINPRNRRGHVKPNARETLENSPEPLIFYWFQKDWRNIVHLCEISESAPSALPCKSGQKQKNLMNICRIRCVIFSVPSCNVPTVVFSDQERTEDCEMIDVENLITLLLNSILLSHSS